MNDDLKEKLRYLSAKLYVRAVKPDGIDLLAHESCDTMIACINEIERMNRELDEWREKVKQLELDLQKSCDETQGAWVVITKLLEKLEEKK